MADQQEQPKPLSKDAEYLLAILVAAGHISESTARQARDLVYEYATDGVGASEIERLRAEQVAGVMPQIGPLLDAWDGMHNDAKGVLREEAPDLAKALVAISRAMDGADGVRVDEGGKSNG